MLLCKVAIGTPNLLWQSDYNANKLPDGKHSTKGCGRYIPDPAVDTKYDDCTLANGKIIEQTDKRGSLMYNEFIVYDVDQVELRYLFKVKAN